MAENSVKVILEAITTGFKEAMSDAVGSLNDLAKADALIKLKDASVEAFGAIKDVAAEYIDIAAEAELVNAQLNSQLKALGSTTSITADQINDLAEELSLVSGFDDEDLVQAQTTLLRFGTLSTEQFDQATRAATDLAAATGMDLTTAFQYLGATLENPAAGFGRLKRYIGDLNIEQQAAVDAAIAAGDTLQAQGIILDALSSKVNGAAAAIGDTWSGKLNIARVNVDNLKQSIGDGLLGVLNLLPQSAIDAGLAITDFGGQAASVIGPLSDLTIILKSLGGTGGALAGVKAGMVGVGGSMAGILGVAAGLSTAMAGLGYLFGTKIPDSIQYMIERVTLMINPFLTLGMVIERDINLFKQLFGISGGTSAGAIAPGAGGAGSITGAAPRIPATSSTSGSTANVNLNIGTLIGDQQTTTNQLVPYIRAVLRQLGVATSG